MMNVVDVGFEEFEEMKEVCEWYREESMLGLVGKLIMMYFMMMKVGKFGLVIG